MELKRRLFNFPAPLSDCRVLSLCEIVPVPHAHEIFQSVETVSTLLYAQAATFLSSEASFVFLIGWLFQMKIEYSQTIRKRDVDCQAFSFLRPFPAASNIATTLLSFFLFLD